MTKFRWHRGSLSDSLATTVEVTDRYALFLLLEKDWHEPVSGKAVDIKHYGFDRRIGWDTHLVTINGHVAGMTDGPL